MTIAELYPLSQLFWYRLLFMAELMIAEALFVFRLRRRSRFWLRLPLAVLFCFGIALAIPPLQLGAAYLSMMFFVMFAFTLLMLKILFEESWKALIFCAIAAYTTQHIAYEMYNLIGVLLHVNGGIPTSVYGNGSGLEFFSDPVSQLNYFWGHALVYWAMLVIFGNRIKRGERIEIKSIPMFVLVVLILIVDIVIGSFITYTSYTDYNRTYMFLLGLYNVALCLCMLYIQFTHLLVRRLNIELDAEKRLRRLEEEQYLLSEANIDLINRKCHDFKHQIRMIGEQSTVDKSVIEEMENAITIYDSMVNTGNRALDTVLTEKSLLCNKKGIRLTCKAGEGMLAFMKDADIYAFFGNALDNAIDAVERLDADRRVIDVTVKRQGNMELISIRNYFEGELVLSDGLPETTKEDRSVHGYGMRSMRRTAERYGGELSVSPEDGIFTLTVLFPALS